MERPRLHVFFPENDLALARNIDRYTAPPAAVKLRRAGATLPLWWADSHDAVLVQGVNDAWLTTIEDKLGTLPGIYRGEPADYSPAPWGWSRAARQLFIGLGYDRTQLPSDEDLEALRMLSHRRTAADVARKLAARLPFAIAPAAEELTSTDAISAFIDAHPGGTILKLPWSSSGRGLVGTDPVTARSQQGMFKGMLSRQGSVMAEIRHTGILDFALLYTMSDDGCRFDGYSLFNNVLLGSYAGNTLAPQAELHDTIADALPDGQLDAIRDALTSILAETAPGYRGPLGVDLMAVADREGYSAALVEINFRMTMGHVCHRLYERRIMPGSRGTFSIRPAEQAPSGFLDIKVSNGLIISGTLDLAQPGSDFSFVVEIEKRDAD